MDVIVSLFASILIVIISIACIYFTIKFIREVISLLKKGFKFDRKRVYQLFFVTGGILLIILVVTLVYSIVHPKVYSFFEIIRDSYTTETQF